MKLKPLILLLVASSIWATDLTVELDLPTDIRNPIIKYANNHLYIASMKACYEFDESGNKVRTIALKDMNLCSDDWFIAEFSVIRHKGQDFIWFQLFRKPDFQPRMIFTDLNGNYLGYGKDAYNGDRLTLRELTSTKSGRLIANVWLPNSYGQQAIALKEVDLYLEKDTFHVTYEREITSRFFKKDSPIAGNKKINIVDDNGECITYTLPHEPRVTRECLSSSRDNFAKAGFDSLQLGGAFVQAPKSDESIQGTGKGDEKWSSIQAAEADGKTYLVAYTPDFNKKENVQIARLDRHGRMVAQESYDVGMFVAFVDGQALFFSKIGESHYLEFRDLPANKTVTAEGP